MTRKPRLNAEEIRIRELEAEGMTRSDAQAVYDAEQMKAGNDSTLARDVDYSDRFGDES